MVLLLQQQHLGIRYPSIAAWLGITLRDKVTLVEIVMSSRFSLHARHAGIEVSVGWDNPLGTFFAQVLRIQESDDPRDPVILWIGTEPREIKTPERLIPVLAPYAELTKQDLIRLRADRASDADRGPTALQRTMLNVIRKPTSDHNT